MADAEARCCGSRPAAEVLTPGTVPAAGPRTLDDVAWPVRTERLLIRRATTADLDVVWPYRSRDDVTQWTSRQAGTSEEFRAAYGEPDRLAATLVIERDGVVVGDLMVKIQDGWAQAEVAEQARGVQAELGWALDPDHHGHGYGTEAVAALLRVCFVDLGLRRVEALCFAANEPSWRLMERLGMRRETHAVAESLHRSGEWLDGYGYALLKSEWEQQHPTP